mmetsp:Transcript_6598/g.9680  ORF Transcript_6598/g.9680 Transcript_6598/m.9680 type:complete len:93 (-) Transcript_6598:459-737(-)
MPIANKSLAPDPPIKVNSPQSARGNHLVGTLKKKSRRVGIEELLQSVAITAKIKVQIPTELYIKYFMLNVAEYIVAHKNKNNTLVQIPIVIR